MSETTPNLGLPYILASQAQKHVTYNEAIRAVDALIQLSAVSRSVAAAPASPADGIRYIVPAGATGAWAGKAGQIAAFQDNAWNYYQPREGWVAWVQDEDTLVSYDGANWATAGGGGSVNPAPLVGVAMTADSTNRLSVKSPAALFDHAGAGHQLKVNKAAASETASLLFQTAYSGRAELGLAGDDNLHFKVSADGSTWKDALVIDRTTGSVSMPFTSSSGVTNPWAGKKWAACGTSITSIGAYTAPLATLLGATLTNLGVAGGSLGAYSGGGLGIYNSRTSIPSDADLVTLEVGVNDFTLGVPLGALYDTTTSTFYGALYAFITSVLATNVNRTMVLLTSYTPDLGSSADWNTANANSNTIVQFQQAVRDVGRWLSCPVIDLTESEIGAQTASLFLSDGIHLNASGGSRYAQFVYDRLLFVKPKIVVPTVATPTFSPTAGTYEGTQSVTISCATAGATIYYTTNGSDPTTGSTVYSGAISVASTTTIKALAVKSGLTNSSIASGTFTISTQVATPAFSPAAGTYGSTQSVTIACATAGATIYYTTNGSDPTTGSTVYSGAISVAATTTVKALAVKSGLTNSSIASATYTISSGFSPADLSPAAWWSASDLTKLFTDTGGATAVTADGQAVALAKERGGNASRDISQSTADARPLYKTDGTRKWLEFDGLDQLICSEFTVAGTTGNFCIAWAARKTETGNAGIVTGTTSTLASFAGINTIGGLPYMTTSGANAGGAVNEAAGNADHTVIINVSGGTATFYVNGSSVGTGGGGAFAQFSSGGLGFNLSGFRLKGRLYECVLVPRALSGGEVTDLTNWMKARAGI